MKLIRIGIIGLLALLALQVSAQKLVSPDGNLVLELQLKKGVPTYQLSYKGKTIIESSRLGLEMEEASLSGEFTQTDVKNSSLDETWSPVWG